MFTVMPHYQHFTCNTCFVPKFHTSVKYASTEIFSITTHLYTKKKQKCNNSLWTSRHSGTGLFIAEFTDNSINYIDSVEEIDN